MTADLVLRYAGVIAAAGIASAINSIAGGGTFLTFPALTGIAGLGEKAANMTSTVGLWPGSAASILAAKPEFRFISFRLKAALCVISLLGGALGSLLLVYTPNSTFSLVIPWLLAFATAVFAFSKPIARWAGHSHGDTSLKWRLFVALIQLLVAIYGGYFGAGIGVLMLAGLSFVGIEDIHKVNALKVLLATVINGIAVVVFTLSSLTATSPADRIHWPLATAMILAAILGGFSGMRLARRIPQPQLRAIILTVGILLTAIYFWKAYLR